METFQLPEPGRVNYLNAEYGLKSWLLTRDHKRIALLYLGSISFFFIIGGIYAMLIRLELLTPQGDLLQSTTYNKVFTQHGIIMVFFFLIPSMAFLAHSDHCHIPTRANTTISGNLRLTVPQSNSTSHVSSSTGYPPG